MQAQTGSVLGTAVASALLFSTALVPAALHQAGAFLSLLSVISPFPLTLKRLRSGPTAGLAAAGLAAVLVGLAFSVGHALAFFLVMALPGLAMGEAMCRGRGLARGCGWAFAILAAEIGLALFFTGPQMANQVLTPLEQYRSAEFLAQMKEGGLPQERVDEWADQIQSLESALEIVYPAAFLILGALVVLANAALLRAYLVRRDPGWLEGGEFESIRWPLALSVAFVLGGALVVVPPLRSFAYNLLLLVGFFYALQGLAVVAYYAHRLAGPPILRVGLVVLVLLNPWAKEILALLGLFDTWFDFRRWADPARGQEG